MRVGRDLSFSKIFSRDEALSLYTMSDIFRASGLFFCSLVDCETTILKGNRRIVMQKTSSLICDLKFK